MVALIKFGVGVTFAFVDFFVFGSGLGFYWVDFLADLQILVLSTHFYAL